MSSSAVVPDVIKHIERVDPGVVRQTATPLPRVVEKVAAATQVIADIKSHEQLRLDWLDDALRNTAVLKAGESL
jgi:hypothetical protein